MKKLSILALAASAFFIYSCNQDGGDNGATDGAWSESQIEELKQSIIDSVVAAKNQELEALMIEYQEYFADSMRIVDSITKATGKPPVAPIVTKKPKPKTNTTQSSSSSSSSSSGSVQPQQPSQNQNVQPQQPTKPSGGVDDRSGAKNSKNDGPKSVNERDGAKNSKNDGPKSVGDREGTK